MDSFLRDLPSIYVLQTLDISYVHIFMVSAIEKYAENYSVCCINREYMWLKDFIFYMYHFCGYIVTKQYQPKSPYRPPI